MVFDTEIFGERLKKLRNARGLTIIKLGKALGVNNATISKWENGLMKPSVDSIFEITKFFGVPAGYLIGTEDFNLETLKSQSPPPGAVTNHNL